MSLLPDDLLSHVRFADRFDVTVFVRSCRRLRSLSTLSGSLRAYGNRLKHELVELLNRDLDQFVSLASQLEGTNGDVHAIIQPLQAVKADLEAVHGQLQQTEEEMDTLLRRRTNPERIQLHQAILHAESVQRLQKLLDAAEQSQRSGDQQMEERIALAFAQARATKAKGGEGDNAADDEFEQSLMQDVVRRLSERFVQVCGCVCSLSSSLSSLSSNLLGELASLLRGFSAAGLARTAIDLLSTDVLQPLVADIFSALDNSGDGDGLGNAVSSLLQLGERVSVLQSSGFAFVADSLWPCIHACLEVRLPRLLAPGRPGLFHANYLQCDRLVTRLNSASNSTIGASAFLSKFNMDVYLRLRLQQIVSQLETALASRLALPSSTSSSSSSLLLPQSDAVIRCSLLPFDSSVYLRPLGHRSFELCLRVLRRYLAFLRSDLSSASPSVALLCAGDVLAVAAKVRTDFTDVICGCIGTASQDVVKPALEAVAADLEVEAPAIRRLAVQSLLEAAEKALEAVPKIKVMYRMSGRQEPRAPLPYAVQLLAPLKLTLSEISDSVEQEAKTQLVHDVVDAVQAAYVNAVQQLLAVVKQTEDSLKRLAAASAGASAMAGSTARVAKQLHLDVHAFVKEVAGVACGEDHVLELLEPLTKLVAQPSTR